MIAGKQYILYKGRVIISDQEAAEIHASYYKQRVNSSADNGRLNNNLLSHFDENSPAMSKQSVSTEQDAEKDKSFSSAQWKNDETFLLQYIVLSLADQKNQPVESFLDGDWKVVASLVPGRSSLQCQKRWLFIQNREGNKSSWTASETQILKQVAEQYSKNSTEDGQEVMG